MFLQVQLLDKPHYNVFSVHSLTPKTYWVNTGVIAVAQIIAWFATDGVAFIAEAALSIMSAEQLIEDAIKAGKACS